MAASARAAVDEAIWSVRDVAPSRNDLRVNDTTVDKAIEMVDRSGVVEKVQEWEVEDRRGPGGASRTFDMRALLVSMVLCATLNEPMTVLAFCEMLFERISPEARHKLGVPEPEALNPAGPAAVLAQRARYRNVRTRFHTLLDLMDPSPWPKNHRVDAQRFEALVEQKARDRSTHILERNYARLTWFCNQWLDLSFRMMPRDWRRKWKGALAVDATPLKAYAQMDSREPGRGRRSDRPLITSSADPDGGLYMRDGDHDGDGADGVALNKMMWAYEDTILVMGADNEADADAFPRLAVGMAPLHRPGVQPGKQAITALQSLHERGFPAGYIAGDAAYTNEKPENFQLPARALGYEPVLDYREDQLGQQGSHNGAIMVEGDWYCPAMPDPLIKATADHKRKPGDPKRIDFDTWQQRLQRRQLYRMRPNGKQAVDGHQRMLCPAAGAAPTLRCARKPKSSSRATGKQRVSLTHLLVDDQPKICRQESTTFPPLAGAKFAQVLPFGSAEWRQVYQPLRSTIEGENGYLKEGTHEALADSTRRRVRGVAAQSVFVALLTMAANIRKLRSYETLAVIDPDGQRRQALRSKRRKTASIESWLPRKAPMSNSPPGTTA